MASNQGNSLKYEVTPVLELGDGMSCNAIVLFLISILLSAGVALFIVRNVQT